MKLAFIPIRSGSKSIKDKNIKILCGKPLIYWSLEALENSSIDKIVVALDCKKYENIVLSFNFKKVEIYRRDSTNAQDFSSTESVMLEFINKANLAANDTFMLIQATSPLIETSDVEGALALSLKYSSVLSCVRSKRFFWDSTFRPLNYNFTNRPRRQDFSGLFKENGAIYISKVGQIVESKNRISGEIGIYEMAEYKGVEIDEELDFILTQSIMRHYQKNRIPSARPKIKLFLSDMDGTLTDGGMYYFDKAEGKRFHTHDGKGFELLKKRGIKCGILTGEKGKTIEKRGKKLGVDYLFMGCSAKDKLEAIKQICQKEGICLSEVAYIGDVLNDILALEAVGLKAAPKNAIPHIRELSGIICLEKCGGNGAVREFIDYILGDLNEIS